MDPVSITVLSIGFALAIIGECRKLIPNDDAKQEQT